MGPPQLRCEFFPLIYLPHLLVLPATFGLCLPMQTYPYFQALYAVSVRQTKGLLTASFRFHLTMDTLAVQLYTSSLPRRVKDFHLLEFTHAGQTSSRGRAIFPYSPRAQRAASAAYLICTGLRIKKSRNRRFRDFYELRE